MIAILENHKDNVFSFKHVSLDETTKEKKILDVKKACQDTDIATKVIKNDSDIFAYYIWSIALSVFPSNFKNNDIIPVQKKKKKNNETTCIPESIFANISKTYQKCFFPKSQMSR